MDFHTTAIKDQWFSFQGSSCRSTGIETKKIEQFQKFQKFQNFQSRRNLVWRQRFAWTKFLRLWNFLEFLESLEFFPRFLESTRICLQIKRFPFKSKDCLAKSKDVRRKVTIYLDIHISYLTTCLYT